MGIASRRKPDAGAAQAQSVLQASSARTGFENGESLIEDLAAQIKLHPDASILAN